MSFAYNKLKESTQSLNQIETTIDIYENKVLFSAKCIYDTKKYCLNVNKNFVNNDKYNSKITIELIPIDNNKMNKKCSNYNFLSYLCIIFLLMKKPKIIIEGSFKQSIITFESQLIQINSNELKDFYYLNKNLFI